MTKHYCDKCKQETQSLYTLPIYKHIMKEGEFTNHVKVINGEMHSISGITEDIDLCIVCYNEVMQPLWNSIKGDVLSVNTPSKGDFRDTDSFESQSEYFGKK